MAATQTVSAQTAAEIAASVTPTNLHVDAALLDPRRYGAIGDGVTDDTAALTRWAKVVNATTNPAAHWLEGLTYLSGALPTITAKNFVWNMSATMKVNPKTWAAASHIHVAGTGFRAIGLTIDGNQNAFSIAPTSGGGQLLQISANDFELNGVSLNNSAGRGLLLVKVAHGRITSSRFDSNANLGAEIEATSYVNILNCTFNFNGYGFQRTHQTNQFAAFALALRFRCHHIVFTNCDALQNGRDGPNVNQGSHAIKFIGCLAWMNGDGGFTIAADQTHSGLPGEEESPYDLEYIGCESYDNWSSGLVAYSRANNVTVLGGRYYNNNRLAGTQPIQSSFPNGVYFAAGSLGLVVKTKAYDDRQLCRITATAVGVLTAGDWTAGAMAYYGTVALYDAAMAFQGYATITAETKGAVTVVATANDGVTIAKIVPGWYVSQRLQHNGCFFDNSCQGEVDIDGFGQLQGPKAPYMGFKAISGFFNHGQNVLNRNAERQDIELLENPSWDTTTGAGTSWRYSLPGGGRANHYTKADQNLHSPGCLQLIGGSSAAIGDGTLISGAASYAQAGWFDFECLVIANDPGGAYIAVIWGPANFGTVVNHPGGGLRKLRVCGYIPAGNSAILFRISSAAGKTCYFDEASARMRFEPFDNRDYLYPSPGLLE